MNALDHDDQTPLDHAKRAGNAALEQFLLDAGATEGLEASPSSATHSPAARR